MWLEQLLSDASRFDAEYGGGMSNHLPMALVALDRLGASEARLAAFATHYTEKLSPAPPYASWRAEDPWTKHLGERVAWPAYRSLFGDWLAKSGTDVVLSTVVPVLMRGCGGAAFHGLIRAAYAVTSRHTGELADALAYWSCRHLSFAAAPNGDEADPLILLSALEADFSSWTARRPLIVARMQEVAAVPAYTSIAARLQVDESTLPALARHAARLYAGSGNFAALHLVTSAHAMRVLLPHVSEPLRAMGHYWGAFAAGCIASRVQLREAAPLCEWNLLVAAAQESNDDHLIKIVDSCREEERCYGGDTWQSAASRAVHQATS